MRQSIFIITQIICIGIALQSCALNEEKVAMEIVQALQNDHSHVNCSYKDGVVTLIGLAKSNQERLSAEKCVRKVRYVKAVRNNIAIGEPKNSIGVKADEFLRTYICEKLSTEGCNNVEVAVRNGEVTLSGHLKKDELMKVMRITNETKPKRILTNLSLRHNR